MFRERERLTSLAFLTPSYHMFTFCFNHFCPSAVFLFYSTPKGASVWYFVPLYCTDTNLEREGGEKRAAERESQGRHHLHKLLRLVSSAASAGAVGLFFIYIYLCLCRASWPSQLPTSFSRLFLFYLFFSLYFVAFRFSLSCSKSKSVSSTANRKPLSTFLFHLSSGEHKFGNR